MSCWRGHDDDLFEQIACFPSLSNAARKATRGKRCKPGAAAFLADLEKEILRLERELRSLTYRPGRYTRIETHELKHRVVSAAPFRDRIVHHALCHAIIPLFKRGFIADSYANREGKGTHRAGSRYERFRDRHRHVLRTDVYRYVLAIDHEVLKRELRRRNSYEQMLCMSDTIVDRSNPQEPVNLCFQGDDLFSPHGCWRGLLFGDLTSQFFANLYLDCIDHFAKVVLRVKGYVRYVDDVAAFHDEPAVLAVWLSRIEKFLEHRRPRLLPGKTKIHATDVPAAFLGYELLPGGRRRLPLRECTPVPQSPSGSTRPLASGDGRWRGSAAKDRLPDCQRRPRRYVAPAPCDFQERVVRPALGPGRSPAPRGFFPAAFGTTNRITFARRTATGTGSRTGTTTTGSVSPARSLVGAATAAAAAGVRKSVQDLPCRQAHKGGIGEAPLMADWQRALLHCCDGRWPW